jgi:anti-sigma factor RsiW
LTQLEFEDLSAYLDGELDARRAAEVRARVESDPAWRGVHAQLQAVDAAMDAYAAPPAPADLPERVLAYVNREASQPVVIRLVRWAAPLAAAAAVLVAAGLLYRHLTASPGAPGNAVRTAPAPAAENNQAVESLVRDNLDFFKDLDVVANLDTLQEMDRMEGVEGPENHEDGT